jgi:hypothetical protein
MVREMADRQDNGYQYEDGLVIHKDIDKMGTLWKHIVVLHCTLGLRRLRKHALHLHGLELAGTSKFCILYAHNVK